MAGLDSWLSAGVMHALGWALIHSLWQGLSVAALAAALMALSRRPSVRYLVAVGALALMLAAPVATFFLLLKASASTHLYPANPGAFASVLPETTTASPTAPAHAAIVATPTRAVVGALENLPRASPKLLPWLVGAWLFGVALFSLRFAGGFLLLEYKRRQSHAPDPRILVLCRELQSRLGLNRAIRYLECSWLEAPAVIGWLRPIVLLPIAALTGLSEEQLSAVIAHELAHIRRLDAFVNLFQILVETLLFYHPAMWWLNRRIRAERELCCDEIAVSLTGNRIEYARALTLMAAWKNAPALAMAVHRGPLSLRILHILGRKPSGAGQRMMGLTGGALFLVAALAAANALFGIAYPIPAAHARESVKAVLSSSQVAVDRAVRQALQAATKTAPEQTGSPETAAQPAKDSQAEKLVPPSVDLSGLPQEKLVTPTVVASNAAPAATSDQPAPSAPASAQASLNATAPSNAPSVYRCRSSKVFARVLSPDEIQLSGFTCFTDDSAPLKFGSCPLSSTDLSDRERGCKFDVTMKVRLADPADAGKMQMNRVVQLGGDVRVSTQNHTDDLVLENARIVQADPFGLSRQVVKCQPAELAELSGRLDRRLCVQNDILANLAVARPALEAAARSPVAYSKTNKPSLTVNSGDADAVTCRQRGTGMQPLNCAYNSFWTWTDLHPHRPQPMNDIGPFYSGENAGTGSGVIAQSGVIFNGR